ncbi:MAG: hypothetical protein KDI62_17340 [Anaerolineae bacterium]|nr:hypothetical protein [Anaerolineae bacterium]
MSRLSSELTSKTPTYWTTILVLVVYGLLAVGLTYPLIFNLTSTVPNDIGDPLLNTWILAWDSHALLTAPLNLFNANIFHPLPNTLAYSEHLISTALLALPIQFFGEPILAYNLSLLLSFPLAAFSMYLLALHWTHQRSAAFIAGLIFGFAPYRLAAIAHLQLLTFQWLPLALLFLDKLLDSGQQAAVSGQRQTRFTICLTVFLTLQLLASWYLAIYTILLFTFYAVIALIIPALFPPHSPTLPTPKKPKLYKLIVPLIITFCLTLPFAFPYLSIVDDLRQARPLSQALALAAAITDYAAAAPFNTIFGPLTAPVRNRPNFTEENTLFLGITAPILALLAVVGLFQTWRQGRRRSTVHRSNLVTHSQNPNTSSPKPTIDFIFLSLSLIIVVALTFPVPYALLAAVIPPTTIIRVPPRWIIPALFALAGLAAGGYAYLHHRLEVNNSQTHRSFFIFFGLQVNLKSTLLLIFCSMLLILETLSVPLPLAHVENRTSLNPVYDWLADQPTDFALLELPMHSAPAPEYPEVKRMYASTLGWWPLINGYSGYTPPRQPILAQALANFPDTTAVTTLQTLATQLPPPLLSKTSPLNSTNSTNSINSMNSITLYLLIHPGEPPLNRTQWETIDRWQVERDPTFQPLGQFDGDYLYQVLPPTLDRFAAPPLATFGSNQTIHLLDYSLSSPNSINSTDSTNSMNSITLFWQSTAPISTAYTIFIHLRAADGFVRSQADGPPVNGVYPTDRWPVGEVIQDIHPLPADDFSQVDHIAIGLYDPATGQRLPAFDINGQRLNDDTVILRLH